MMQSTPRLRTWPARIAFCLFAGLIPESIATFNNVLRNYIVAPATLFFIAAFYGFADALIREALIRRRIGWAGILLLGIAFGAINEGIVAVTWFRVVPTGYTIIHGVDFVWAVALTIFHSTISTVVPIALSQVLFPRIADRSWLGRKGMITVGIVLALETSLGFVKATYRINQVPVIISLS